MQKNVVKVTVAVDNWMKIMNEPDDVFSERLEYFEVEGLYDKAILIYNKAIENGFIRPKVFARRGYCYLKLKMFQKKARPL